MKGTKRILSGLLALCMVMSMLPVQTFAEEEILEEAAVATEAATEGAEETVTVTEAATEPAEGTTVPVEPEPTPEETEPSSETEPEPTQDTEAATEPTEETVVPTEPEISVTEESVNSAVQDTNCNGSHVTVIDEAVEPSCTETGLTEGCHCGECGEVLIEQEEIPALGHRVYFDQPVEFDPLIVENTDAIPFALENGTYYSANHTDGSTSSLHIVAKENCDLTLNYGVSSEQGWDELYILYNDIEQDMISGEVTNQILILELAAGDVVTVRYSKDGSVNEGQDQGWVALDYEKISYGSGDVLIDELTPDCINGIACSYCETVVKIHTEVIDAAVEANCSNNGLTEGKHCSACGEVFVVQEVVPANGIHVYVKGVCTYCGLTDGTCGENAYWTFEETTGVLTISGRGSMYDFDSSVETPWSDYLEEIEAVVLKNGITDIGSYAFADCVNLTNISIPDSVEYAEDYCFSGCSSLKTVTVPGSVYMREGVFMDCTALEAAVLCEGMTGIGDYAFYGCSALKTISIPQSIYTSPSGIGEYAFSRCESLQTISTGTAWLNGYYYGGTFSDCTGLKKAIVSELPGYVFSGCSNLEEVVVLTDSYASMMYGAFADCNSLTTVTFLGACPSDINSNLFDGRTVTVYYPAGISEWDAVVGNNYGGEVTWVPLPTSGSCGEGLNYSLDVQNETLTISGNGSMDSWDSVNSFAPWYGYRSAISNVFVEDGVASFNHLGFDYNTITFQGDAPAISANAFAGKYSDSTKQVFYPADNSTWDAVAGKQFGGNGNISWAPLGGAVEQIKTICQAADTMTQEEIRTAVQAIDRDDLLEAMRSGAIYDEMFVLGGYQNIQLLDTSLSTIVVTEMYRYAYGADLNDPIDSNEDHEVVISGTQNPIAAPTGYSADDAIAFNVSITNLKKPDVLTVPVCLNMQITHGSYLDPFVCSLFWNNKETGEVEEVPFTLTWEMSGFNMSCVIEGTGEYLLAPKSAGLSGSCGNDLKWNYNNHMLVISGSGVMDNYDLNDNLPPWNYFRENVDYLTIENGITEIGSYAFNDCRFVSNITIPASVECIGEGAFYCLDNVSALTFEGDAPAIENKAFYGMRCTAYYNPDKAGWEEATQSYYGAEGYDFSWKAIEKNGICGDALTWVFDESTGKLIISGSGDMYHYLFDEEEAPWFPFAEKVKMIIIEEGATGIGAGAFYMCPNVEILSLPDSLTTLSFTEGTLPPMDEVTVPAGVTEIFTSGGENSYINVFVAEENPAYASIDGVLFNKEKTELLMYPGGKTGAYNIPEGTTHIADWSFTNNTKVSAITFPESLISIGNIAFSYCTALTEIVIPDNVTTIGRSAFSGCSSLNKIVFGKNVNYLGDSVLGYCYGLDEIVFSGDAPVIEERAFSSVQATAYYPVGNETWTEEVMQNYSGQITWEAYELKPTVAKIGNVGYSSITEALAASKAGDTITLLADVQTPVVTVTSGVTINLGEHNLKADFVVAFNGAVISATPNAGRLIVPKGNLILSEAGTNEKGQSILPVWDPANENYVFSLFVANTGNDARGLFINEEEGTLFFQWKHQATGAINKSLMADNGSTDNDVTMLVRLQWGDEDGVAYQNYVFKDSFVQKAAGSFDYTVTLKGIDTLGIDLSTLVVTAMITTESGAEAAGQIWTIENAK